MTFPSYVVQLERAEASAELLIVMSPLHCATQLLAFIFFRTLSSFSHTESSASEGESRKEESGGHCKSADIVRLFAPVHTVSLVLHDAEYCSKYESRLLNGYVC